MLAEGCVNADVVGGTPERILTHQELEELKDDSFACTPRCPGCHYPLVARLVRGGVGFPCGCALEGRPSGGKVHAAGRCRPQLSQEEVSFGGEAAA